MCSMEPLKGRLDCISYTTDLKPLEAFSQMDSTLKEFFSLASVQLLT
jgi:hypothetical protein